MSKIKVISDLEGYPIPDPRQNEEIIICGDITDTTSQGMSQVELLAKKSNNLKNIWKINNNKKISVIFGNRDLNKIKCKHVNKLKLTENEINNILINKFNDGEIDLSYTTYEKFINLEWVCDMKNWYPFWAPDEFKIKYDAVYSLSRTSNNELFIDRFNLIFGDRAAKAFPGTMSAGALLNSIPHELGITYDNDNYKAFIVLAIYNSMLFPQKLNTTNNVFLSVPVQNLNSNMFKGWLYHMYTNSKNLFCKSNKLLNKLVLFSHGGITKRLIDNFNDENDNILKKLKTYITELSPTHKIRVQDGGVYLTTTNNTSYSTSTITDKINKINRILKYTLKDCLDEQLNANPSNNMLFLLSMTIINIFIYCICILTTIIAISDL
jgi:hypothetical protein